MIYVTSELKESILIIDPKTRQIVGTIPTGSNTTHVFSLSADEQRIFTSNVGGRTLSVLDVPGRTLIKTIPTDSSNQRMAISPDQKLFVTNLGQERKVAVYNTSDGTPAFSVELDGGPFVSRFSPDGRFLYVMGSAGGGRRGGGRTGSGAPAAAAHRRVARQQRVARPRPRRCLLHRPRHLRRWGREAVVRPRRPAASAVTCARGRSI